MLLASGVCTLANAEARSAILAVKPASVEGESGWGSDGKKCGEQLRGTPFPVLQSRVVPLTWG